MVTPSRRASGPRTIRRLNTPRRVDVQCDNGTLIAVQRASGWLSVIELLDRYRTDDRWWTEEPISRMYYELLLEDGRTVTILHDECSGTWSEQRYG